MTEHERRMGRPKLPDDERRDLLIKMRATPREVEQYEALGGADWLRQALKRAFSRLKGDKSGG